MELAHRWGDRNLTRLELVVAILILAIMIGFFSKYALTIFSRAEQSMVNRTVTNINTALSYRAVLAVLQDDHDELEKLMKMNPFVEMHLPPKIDEYDLKPNDIPLSMGGELVVTPSNYARVIYAGDEDSLEKGKWYFNQAELLLVYVINNTELFTSEIEGSPRIRFRIALDYNDRNGNGQYESTIDEFRNMKLTSIDQYQWN